MSIKDDMEDVQEAVINELITENGITNTLADGQVTETKILNGAVTENKIDDGAVTAAKLGSDVNLGQVNTGAVTEHKIANGAVTPTKLSQAYLPLTGGSVTGNLLVGHTSTSSPVQNGGSGVTATAEGQLFVGCAGTPFYVNREDSSGDMAVFRKDGVECGAIGGGDEFLSIGKSDTGIAFYDIGNFIYPSNTAGVTRDNAIDIGFSSGRFDDIYATNGTIQTSDRNEKQDIEELSEAEQRVAVACKGLLRKFRWKSSVEENGAEARIHFGIIAQDLQAAFEAEGLDAGRYAMFISSTWTDEETEEEKTRLGVRYSELLAFIISAI